MVGQLLQDLVLPARLLDPAPYPLRQPGVATGPFRLGEGLVGDLAHQSRAELPLAHGLEGQQVLGRQLVEHRGRGRLAPGLDQGHQGVERARASHHGRVLQRLPLRGGQGVEAGGDQAPQGGRQLRRARCPAPLSVPARQHGLLAQETDELLQEQGVPAAALEQQLAHLGRRLPAQERTQESGRLGLVEGIHVQQHQVAVAGLVGPAGLQLGTGRAHDHHGHVPEPLQQPVDPLQHRLVGPVQLGQHDHHGLAPGQALHEGLQGAAGLVPGSLGVDVGQGLLVAHEIEEAVGQTFRFRAGGVGPLQY